MGHIEAAIKYSKEIESLLEAAYGAQGKGLHEKTSSVEDFISPEMQRQLRYIASIRNKLVHEDGYEIDDYERFASVCESVLEFLRSQPKQDAHKPVSQTLARLAPQPGEVTELGRKSWTAYVKTVLVGLFSLVMIPGLVVRFSAIAGIITFVGVVAFFVHRIMLIRSHRLYYDDIGVWIMSGVLPWEKGIGGVKWRDLDEALFFPSVTSWILRSYTIRIGHRFTKSSEIVLTDWAQGREVVTKINGQHESLVRNGSLR